MEEIKLTQEEFLLFNQDDQFGFFYDENGFPPKYSEIKFASNVAELYKKYDYISVDSQDNIYGIAKGEKELLMGNAIEAYEIAEEVINL